MKLQLLLVAVAVPSRDAQQSARVILNPSGAGGGGGGRSSPAAVVTIDAGVKGFFVCQSQDDAKRAVYYCDSCHGNVANASQINRCACSEKGDEQNALRRRCVK